MFMIWLKTYVTAGTPPIYIIERTPFCFVMSKMESRLDPERLIYSGVATCAFMYFKNALGMSEI